MLDAHGFAEQQIEAVALEARSPTARELAVGLVRGTPMANMIEQRGGDFERIAEAVAAALAGFGRAAPFRSPPPAPVFPGPAGCGGPPGPQLPSNRAPAPLRPPRR